jgi:hypothetical protein
MSLQLRAQGLGAGEDGPAGHETIRRVIRESLLDAHVRRFVAETRGLELVARRPGAAIRERISHLLPGLGRVHAHRRTRVHHDLHLRSHGELAMRLRELDAQHGIAECIQFAGPALRRGLDGDLVFEALLVRRRPRHEMQQVMGMHHVRAVEVTCLVANAVLAAAGAVHVASACASESMSAK